MARDSEIDRWLVDGILSDSGQSDDIDSDDIDYAQLELGLEQNETNDLEIENDADDVPLLRPRPRFEQDNNAEMNMPLQYPDEGLSCRPNVEINTVPMNFTDEDLDPIDEPMEAVGENVGQPVDNHVFDIIEAVIAGAGGDGPLIDVNRGKNKEPTMLWDTVDDYQPKREDFLGLGHVGPQIPVGSPLDIFQYFFDDALMDIIVNSTNSYAEQQRTQRGMIFKQFSRQWKWTPVTKSEMYVYLGLVMLMGIDQRPSVRSYFSANPLLRTEIYPGTMSLERFELITKYLHFCDSTRLSEYQGQKGLSKIFPVVDHLNNRFKSSYGLSQNISIDESLTLWKGRLNFKQYLPLKAAQFGIKSFELCESSTGFTWSFIIYTGKNMVFDSPVIPPKSNKSTAIVLSLLEPLLNRGYTCWMDNWYNAPDLSAFLKKSKTDTCGTLKLSRKNVPNEIKEAKLEKGEITVMHSDDVMVMKWRDKRVVTLISTFHSHEMEQRRSRSGKDEMKPVLVYDYNKQMGGVDLRDQMLYAYLLERKRGLKWYVKIFKRLLNISILNSYIIWKTENRKGDHLSFRLDLVKLLLETYGSEVRKPVSGRPSTEPKPARLTERHFIYLIPPTGNKLNAQRRCCVCSKRGVRKDTRYWCPKCEAGLCLGTCFEDYHSKLHF